MYLVDSVMTVLWNRITLQQGRKGQGMTTAPSMCWKLLILALSWCHLEPEWTTELPGSLATNSRTADNIQDCGCENEIILPLSDLIDKYFSLSVVPNALGGSGPRETTSQFPYLSQLVKGVL